MTTTPNVSAVAGHVLAAIEEIRIDFQPAELTVEPDGQGGARVRFGPVALGSQYAQRETWLAGQIPVQIPYADIYPVFVRGDLARTDGRPLAAPLSNGHQFMGLSAVQASRRSNRRDATIETPKMKFKKVLDWVNLQ